MEPTPRALSEPGLEPPRLLQHQLAAGAPRRSMRGLRRSAGSIWVKGRIPALDGPGRQGHLDSMQHAHHALLLAVTLAGSACLDDKSPADTSQDTTTDAPSDTAPGDTTTDVAGDTGPGACGECAAPRLCCPSRFEGDIARCVDPTLNPENCGGCGTFCGGACYESQCIEAAACGADGTCPEPLQCSNGSGQARCCPAGTTFIASPADFFGCCPDGDICGCREGNCPISQRAAKQEIRYVEPGELARLGEELLATRLATYRYRDATSGRRQLGFIIDDGTPGHAIAADRTHVDLYGYVSLAVATLQVQARELEQLRAELDELRRRVEAMPR